MAAIQKEKLYIPMVGNDVPPQSRTVIFLCQYCGYDSFDVVLVQTATPKKSSKDEEDFTKDKTKSDSWVGPTNDVDGSSVWEKAIEEPSGGILEAVGEPSSGMSKTSDCLGGSAKAVEEPSCGISEAVGEPSSGLSKTAECSPGPANAVEEPSATPMLGHTFSPPSGDDFQDYMIKDVARKFSEVSLKPTCSALNLEYTLKDIKDVDWLVQQCQLPAIVGAGSLTCYSGLCAVLRRIVHKGHERHQDKNLDALLVR